MLLNDLLNALDPVSFARVMLNIEPDPWQAKALNWTGKRLILNCSRQSGKSTTASILALHRSIYYPGSLILLISPSLRQSAELFRKVNNYLGQLKQLPRKKEDNKLSMTLENGSRIISLPSSEATIRGFSAVDLIIEDEASRVTDELYYSIRPMLAVNNGALILMSTPFGKRGHFHKEWTEGSPEWERIEIPATECSRISKKFLEEELNALGEWWYKQEYLCQFVETTDQVFLYEQVMTAMDDDVKPLFGEW